MTDTRPVGRVVPRGFPHHDIRDRAGARPPLPGPPACLGRPQRSLTLAQAGRNFHRVTPAHRYNPHSLGQDSHAVVQQGLSALSQHAGSLDQCGSADETLFVGPTNKNQEIRINSPRRTNRVWQLRASGACASRRGATRANGLGRAAARCCRVSRRPGQLAAPSRC